MFRKIRVKLYIAITKIKNLFPSKKRRVSISPNIAMGIPGMAAATGITMALGLPPSAAVSMSLTGLVLLFLGKVGPTHRPHVVNLGSLDFEREFKNITKNL